MNRRGFLATIAAALSWRRVLSVPNPTDNDFLTDPEMARELREIANREVRKFDTRKLSVLKRQKAGLSVSPWEVAEVFDISSFGSL
jgi:hypothetical protein